MRKIFWFLPLFFIVLAGLLTHSVSPSQAASDLLTLDAPSECPSDGCAAGQRLNFLLDYEVDPKYLSATNTQICVFIPTNSESGGQGPWAEWDWISETGLETAVTYIEGDPNNLCSPDSDEKIIGNAYAQLPGSAESDQLEVAVHVYANTRNDGHVRVEVFQANAKGNFGLVTEDTENISVVKKEKLAYVSQTPEDCNSYSPCYVNSGDDETDGVGTGLRDAIMTMNAGSEIVILKDYTIKDHAVLVDKELTISGSDGARITYNGNRYSEPMLTFTQGGVIKDLTINDGHWETPSRTLIQADTPVDLTIEHNTLTSGSRAVDINNNTGSVTIIFNHIIDNDDQAIYATSTSGNVSIYANNIIDNGSTEQVHCSNHDSADHNYWGEDTNAEESVSGCDVSNGKQLGAPILISSGGAGVEAILKTVTDTLAFDIFDNDIGVMHTNGNDFDVIIVNHGQGEESNIPFLESAGAIDACSNFYDIFLAENANPTNLILSLKYDLTSSCRIEIESSDYCDQEDMSKYPLWWYDPANNVTDGWDRTGQNPEGPGAGDALRQKTVCDMETNTINVTIDDSGKPELSDDLLFTPFVTGLPISSITVSKFTGEFITSKTYLNWTTTSEKNIKEFRIYRSETRTGDYSLIKSGIDAIGDADNISTIYYTYEDSTMSLNQTYYYKLDIIDTLGDSVKTYGPVEITTSNPTRTATYYPTLTPVYDPNTSTPRQPTQVRTYQPSPIPSRTNYSKPTETSIYTRTPDNEGGYPVDTSTTTSTQRYSAPEEEVTPTSTTIQTYSPTPTTASVEPGEAHQISWGYLLLGALSGFGFLAIVSIILQKSQLS